MPEEKLCIFCTHWYMTNRTQDYSDMTPGNDYEEGCIEGHWEHAFDSWETTEEEYRKLIRTAETCNYFSHVKDM